jgi:hypothetical protein
MENTKKVIDDEFGLDKDFSESHIIYVNRSNKTMWKRIDGKWSCALCNDKLTLCRGCGGMSSMYEDCFGSCGDPFLLCPNCVCLKGPDKCRYFEPDAKYVNFDAHQYYGWKENNCIEGNCRTSPYDSISDKFTGSFNVSFVTFKPNQINNLKFFKYSLEN